MKIPIAILILAFACKAQGGRVCTVAGGNKLEPYNGKPAKLDFPCKYNLARYQCGDWMVRLTPGHNYLVPHFHIFTVWFRLSNQGSNLHWEGRTTNKIVAKFINGDQEFPFNLKEGNSTSDVLSCTKTSNNAICQTYDGQVRITFGPFIPDTAGLDEKLVFECLVDESTPPAFPAHMCGGDDVKEARQKAVDLGFATDVTKVDSEARDKTYLFYAMTDDTTDQHPEPRCSKVVNVMNTVCPDDAARVQAVELCYRILYSRPHRRCITKFSCDLIDAYLACTEFVCSGFQAGDVCQVLGDYLDQCRNFPGLSDTVKKCYRGQFISLD